MEYSPNLCFVGFIEKEMIPAGKEEKSGICDRDIAFVCCDRISRRPEELCRN